MAVTVITCLVAVVIFRAVHTLIATGVLTPGGFLHLPWTALLGAFGLDLLQKEKKSQRDCLKRFIVTDLDFI